MIVKRKEWRVPSLNTTATADISFMLLIFFLVTSSMDTDKGLTRQLPPAPDTQEEVLRDVLERNVLSVRLTATGSVVCADDTVSLQELQRRVVRFVANAADDPALPERSEADVHLLGRCRISDKHIIRLEADREATYDSYFQLQNAIVRAYAALRNHLARRRFGCAYARCTPAQREAVMTVYPQRISENLPGEGQRP